MVLAHVQGPQYGRFSEPRLIFQLSLDTALSWTDTLQTMCTRLTTFLVLAAITLQGVFGSLQGSVMICLGGGHEHAATEVVKHCDLACTHHSEWPTPAAQDEHHGDCACTDFELNLIVLLMTPLTNDHELDLASIPAGIRTFAMQQEPTTPPRAPPRTARDDPGAMLRLATICSTRLQV